MMSLQPKEHGSVEHVGNQGTMLEHALIIFTTPSLYCTLRLPLSTYLPRKVGITLSRYYKRGVIRGRAMDT